MTGFSLNLLKENIRDKLRSYLYPQCLTGSFEHTLSTASSTISVAQSFIPYCKFYKKESPYKETIDVTLKLKKYGSPDGDITLSLQSSSNGLPSGHTLGSAAIPRDSISTSWTEYTSSLKITSMLGSNTKYFLVIEPKSSPSLTDCFVIARNTVDTGYWIGSAYETTIGTGTWSSLNADLYFRVKVKDWIFDGYPREDISLHSFPRVAVDIIGRRVNQRWIDRRLSEYYLDLSIVAFSRFANELDDILSYCDRALFKERVNISQIKRIDPVGLTPLTVVRERIFTRALRYNIIYKMYES